MYIKVIGTTGLGLAVLNILGFMKGVIMRKFNFRKILSLALAAFVAFGTFAVGAVNVNAATEDWKIFNDTVWLGSEQWDNYIDVYDNASPQTRKAITSATSSDTSVFSIKTEAFEDGNNYFIIGVAPGTAKLTVSFTTQSGETKTLSKNIVVKKYPKEIKSLKVNGKKVSTSKHKFNYRKKISKSKSSVKIKMALKKGWKITSIYADRSKTGEKYTTFKVSKSALTKGKAIKFSKKYKYMWIRVAMKKGKNIIWYSFDFYR